MTANQLDKEKLDLEMKITVTLLEVIEQHDNLSKRKGEP